MTHASAKRVSKLGSLSQQHKFRVRPDCEVTTKTPGALKMLGQAKG
jgi:hypothetical protein